MSTTDLTPIAALRLAAARANRVAELYRLMADAAEELEALGAGDLPAPFPVVYTGPSAQPIDAAGNGPLADVVAIRPSREDADEPPAPAEPPAGPSQAVAPTPAASSSSPPPPAVLPEPRPPAHDPAAEGDAPPAPHSSAAPAPAARQGGRHIKRGPDGLYPRGREVLRSLTRAPADELGWVMVNSLAREDASSTAGVKRQLQGLIADGFAESNGRATSQRRYRATAKGLNALGLEPRSYPLDGEEDERPEPPPTPPTPPAAPPPPPDPAPPASEAQTPPRPAANTRPTTVGETQAAIHAAISDAPLNVPELSHGLSVPREAANAALNWLVQNGYAKASPAGRRDGFQTFEAVRGRSLPA